MDEEVAKLKRELAALNADFDITLGRANGLNAAVLVLARGWGKPAEAVISHLETAIERIEATSLSTPLPDATIAEAKRVATQVLDCLKSAQQEGG